MFSSVVVFMENRAGKLAEITKILAVKNINILNLSIDDSGQFGILRLIVDKPEKAREVLYNANYKAALEKIIFVELKDEIGAFAEFLSILDEEKINISQASGSVIDLGNKAIFTVMSDDPEHLLKVLKESDINIIDNIEEFLAGIDDNIEYPVNKKYILD